MQILIIPAQDDSRERWAYIIRILEAIGYQVTYHDYAMPETDDLEEQTNAAEHYLVQKTVVVGAGIGGRIAVQLLARKNPYISSALLLATPSLLHKTLGVRLMNTFLFLTAPVRLFISHKRQKRIAAWYQKLRHPTPESYRYHIVTASEQDTLLPIIEVPVKLVWGQKKVRVPFPVAEAMCRLLKRADVIVVKGATEPLQWHTPDVIASYIDELAKSN